MIFMHMPNVGSKLKAGGASLSAFPRSAFTEILHRGIANGSVALLALACILSSAVGAFAQEERPQIVPGERKAQKKKNAGPRAVGVLQMTANGKASLVPIAILIDGKFWDASAYKADPIPMALEPETVYEAERAGNSIGLFTVGSALHRNNAAVGDLAPWIGTGAWHPNGSEPETRSAKAEAVPVGIDTSEGPPRLTRDPAAKDKPPDSAAGKIPESGSAPTSSPSKPAGQSSDEPPRLSKPGSSPPTSSPSDSNPPAQGGAKPSSDKAGETKAGEAKNQPNVPASDSGASDSNRPRLRRGKPAEPVADEDVPGYSKAGTKSGAADLSKTPIAKQGDVQLIPAISDAGGPEIHSFVFQWLKGEEDDRRKQMTDFAKAQLRAYVAARAKADIAPIAPKGATRPTRVKAAVKEPILENVRMVAYDVWRSNQPVMILSADGHMPPPTPGTAHSEVESELQYSVVVVAFPDIYNNLHKLYVGITDKFHLDVTPRLELIDALDADGDSRGELLFRETSDQGTGWVIYRPTADKLWKMFDSLRPE